MKYNYGANAIAYEVEYEDAPSRHATPWPPVTKEETSPKTVQRSHSAKKTAPLTAASLAGRLLFQLSLLIMIFGMAMGLLYFKVNIAAIQVDVNSLKTQIADMQETNSKLTIELSQYSNIENIKEKAEEMGMFFPKDESSLRRVNLKNTDSDTDTVTSMNNSK